MAGFVRGRATPTMVIVELLGSVRNWESHRSCRGLFIDVSPGNIDNFP